MTPDTLIPKFLQKITELERVASNPNNDRNEILSKINKLINWVVSDRSLQEHKCCFSFMKYLYNSYGEQFKSFEGFIDWLKRKNDMAHVDQTEAIIDGTKVIFFKYKPKSLSFGSCTQKVFHKFFNSIQEFAKEKWKVDFDTWKKQWEKNENTVQ